MKPLSLVVWPPMKLSQSAGGCGSSLDQSQKDFYKRNRYRYEDQTKSMCCRWERLWPLPQCRAGSAGSLDSLAEILGPLPASADEGTAPPKTADGPVAVGASPVAAGGSEQSRQAGRSAASC